MLIAFYTALLFSLSFYIGSVLALGTWRPWRGR